MGVKIVMALTKEEKKALKRAYEAQQNKKYISTYKKGRLEFPTFLQTVDKVHGMRRGFFFAKVP